MLIKGKQIKSVPVDRVETNDTRQFVSSAEKSSWNDKTSVDDNAVNTDNTWSSEKVNAELTKKVDVSPNYSLVYNKTEEALEIIFK